MLPPIIQNFMFQLHMVSGKNLTQGKFLSNMGCPHMYTICYYILIHFEKYLITERIIDQNPKNFEKISYKSEARDFCLLCLINNMK